MMNLPLPIRVAICCACLPLVIAGCSSKQDDETATPSSANSRTEAELASSDTAAATPAPRTTTKAKPIDYEAFRLAAYEGRLEQIQKGIDAGAVVDQADSQQMLTALHMAAYNGHSACVGLLLKNQAQVDARDHEGKTPLTHACTGPFTETVKILVAAGADVNAKESTEGFTPLMMAAGLGETSVVRALLQLGADHTIADADGDLAIDHAKKSGHSEIVALLTTASAPSNP